MRKGSIRLALNESSFITGNYEKLFVSLDDFCLPSNEGMRHVWAWELYGLL